MTADEFRESLRGTAPPAGLTLALQALWWMAKGDWSRAHGLIDDAEGRDEAWVHAHLHRVEGDLGNAAYWYRRAAKQPASGPLEAERESLIDALLASD